MFRHVKMRGGGGGCKCEVISKQSSGGEKKHPGLFEKAQNTMTVILVNHRTPMIDILHSLNMNCIQT